MAEWLPIAEAPKDGTPVFLRAETNPEYGEHLMYWSVTYKRFLCKVHAPMRVVAGYWDDDCNPPTHFRLA